jgi:prepilin-type N-terminal cleavage/methylation domain-containing protein
MHIKLPSLTSRLRRRLAGDDGFTLIELLIVVQILGILTVIAVPDYMSFRWKAEQVAAESDVRSAQPAAEMWYSDASGGNGTYTGLMHSKLVYEAPGIPSTVKAVALNSGAGYCIEALNGPYTYDYIGGTATARTGWQLYTVQATSCLTAAGTAALST